MATNNNGHLVDDKGNVVVDFVWGNLPLQPNDDRVEPALLDYTLDNHIVADAAYNGYPLYVPNTRGADTSLTLDYIKVPSVLGKTSALAIDALEDAGFATKAGVGTITSNTGTTAKALTRVNVTSTTVAVVYLANANTLFTVGSKVKIAAGTSIPAAVVNTTTGWEVTASDATTVTIKGTGFTVADTGVIAPAATVTGASGTVTYQSIVADTASVAPGTAITITAWA
ncbi:hypothetical protein UFOVP223_73 [uncultured Caudovirales phage]|uniref:Uncharacterized protein n=1 Tax=uncultured Caudovirales phage TaxID=2100421 RepID=A0A6J7WRN2_9CAUD|nr:hypothetical protein UFOVP110_91 [uncultured Caudovirales phage]CAB5219425.1 hypothetical protein UFOVP223_73 [uncultured Caudovirales phage]